MICVLIKMNEIHYLAVNLSKCNIKKNIEIPMNIINAIHVLWGNFVWSDPRKTHWLLDNYKTKLTIIAKLAIMTYQPPLSRIMALFCESIVCVTSKIQNNYFLLSMLPIQSYPTKSQHVGVYRKYRSMNIITIH